MDLLGPSPLTLDVQIESWPLVRPFRITGHTWKALDHLVVTLEQEGKVGRGEAAGIYYSDDRPRRMLQQIDAVRRQVEIGVSRKALQNLLRGVARATLWIARFGTWKHGADYKGEFMLADRRYCYPLTITRL